LDAKALRGGGQIDLLDIVIAAILEARVLAEGDDSPAEALGSTGTDVEDADLLGSTNRH
jgi:hypothetical protein